ncbi:MAG: FHA domain-containing protein, partial [Planctomycetota bacterium]
MALKLRIDEESGSRTVPLGNGPVVLGRSEDAGIRIEEPRASREHLEIRPAANGVHIRDLGSTNGTYRGKERVLRTRLRPGDRLEIGGTSLTIVDDAPPPRAERSSTSRTLLALFAPALILLILAQAGLYAVTSSRGGEIDRALRRIELAELRLATTSMEEDPGGALTRLEAFLEKHPRSAYRADARAAVEKVRPKVNR